MPPPPDLAGPLFATRTDALPSLARLRSTLFAQLAATFVASLLLFGALGIAPFARAQAHISTGFLAAFATFMMVVQWQTALLLTIQFIHSRQRLIGALAAAYLYAAPVMTLQYLTLPHVYSERAVIDSSVQSAAWLWIAGHGGFPSFIAVAIMTSAAQSIRGIRRERMRAALGLTLLLPTTLALMTVWICVVAVDHLPVLVRGSAYVGLARSTGGVWVISANLLALVGMLAIGRGRHVLGMWLAVVLLANSIDVGLTLVAEMRYTVGWYAARVASMIGATVLLAVLLWEISKLYGWLADTNLALEDQATRDAMTGLHNRRYFDRALEQHLHALPRSSQPLSLILIDIDYFKQYNDNFGHVAGDRCIQALGRVLRTFARRRGDIAARIGGEEFGVLLPGVDADLASEIAEEIRVAVLALALPAPAAVAALPGMPGVVSISLGVAQVTRDECPTPAMLLSRADAAMYQAKRDGRNRIVTAEPMRAAQERAA